MSDGYEAAIAYLESLVGTPTPHEPAAPLIRAQLMLTHLGDPQQRFATLHVTGSSGKGSTSAMAASILRAAGYHTGLFISPHVEEYTERIAVDGEPISRDDWTRLLDDLRPLVERMGAGTLPGYTLGWPTLRQVLWPMAAQYFAQRGVEVAVVEVGLGGRYDPTTVNNARVAVITNVTLEHTQQLGPTVAAIAYHKAGVAKPGGIVVTAARDAEALEVIAAECARLSTALWRVTPREGDGVVTPWESDSVVTPWESGGVVTPRESDGVVTPRESDGAGTVHYAGDAAHLRVSTPVRTYDGLRLSLLGRHQGANAACAVAAIDALQTLGVIRAGEDAVRRGLATARIAGRLEWIDGDPPALLDGAHNPDAARALAAALRDTFPEQSPVLLLGILGDKNIAAMVDVLAPLARAVVVTEPPWEGRSGKGDVVAHAVERHLHDVTLVPDVSAALEVARRRARDLNAPLVVAGSLILVGAVRTLLRRAP